MPRCLVRRQNMSHFHTQVSTELNLLPDFYYKNIHKNKIQVHQWRTDACRRMVSRDPRIKVNHNHLRPATNQCPSLRQNFTSLSNHAREKRYNFYTLQYSDAPRRPRGPKFTITLGPDVQQCPVYQFANFCPVLTSRLRDNLSAAKCRRFRGRRDRRTHTHTQTHTQIKQELIRRWDSERELLRSAPGSYPNSLK